MNRDDRLWGLRLGDFAVIGVVLGLLALTAILPGCARTAITPAKVEIDRQAEDVRPKDSTVETFTFRVWPRGQADPGGVLPPDEPIAPGPLPPLPVPATPPGPPS